MTKMFGSRLMPTRDRAEFSWGVSLFVLNRSLLGPRNLSRSCPYGFVGSLSVGNRSKLVTQFCFRFPRNLSACSMESRLIF